MGQNLDEFVDREAELASFADMLHDQHCRMYLLHGPDGIGKTSVLHRVRQECMGTSMKAVVIDFRDNGHLAEPDQVIRRLREHFGGAFDRCLGQVVVQTQQEYIRDAFSNMFAAPGDGVHGEVQISGSKEIHVEGDIIGGVKLELNHSTLVVNPGGGPELVRHQIETRLNAALPTAFQEAQAQEPTVLFFDHFEKATEVVSYWLLQNILYRRLREPDKCPNLWFVIAGRTVPLQNETDQWQHLIHYQSVGPLDEEAIHLFWVEKRGLDPDELPEVISTCEGIPLILSWCANDKNKVVTNKPQ